MRTVAIDTNVVSSLLRGPKSNEGRVCLTPIDVYLMKKQVEIAIDSALGIISEWKQTCGKEQVEALIIHWEQFGAFVAVPIRKIPAAVSKKLRIVCLNDTCDKLLVKIAMALGKIIVSRDHDFNPAEKILSEDLGITVLRLKDLLVQLKSGC